MGPHVQRQRNRGKLGRVPEKPEAQDGSSEQARPEGLHSERLRASAATRIQIRTSGYVARHPALLKVLQWLGWNNPGGSMNP
jgi:hypothetical protein